MTLIHRNLLAELQHCIERGKSVLLLGARQTGKTTLTQAIKHELRLNLMLPETRQRLEVSPQSLYDETVTLASSTAGKLPLVIIDEVQKVPDLMDVVQVLIDEKHAQFILTGSSARKLRRNKNINLLPGRVIKYQLDPIALSELQSNDIEIPILDLLKYGSLPEIICTHDAKENNELLASYVTTYLEEEIRAEALVRNVGEFSKFLQLAAAESGNITHFSAISQQLGVSQYTVASHYEILTDCLIAEEITPIIKSSTRKRLAKASKFLFFDLGVRRLSAKEGDMPSQKTLGQWFEQWVGIELCKMSRLFSPWSVHFWRDNDSGVEVDWVIRVNEQYIPIEVKLTDLPRAKDIRHLQKFLNEYKEAKQAWVVCQAPRKMRLTENIIAIPWQELSLLNPSGTA